MSQKTDLATREIVYNQVLILIFACNLGSSALVSSISPGSTNAVLIAGELLAATQSLQLYLTPEEVSNDTS